MPPSPRISALRTILAWHRETSFWRDVYVRGVSAILAAVVIAAGAALVGVIPWATFVKLLVLPTTLGLIAGVATALLSGKSLIDWMSPKRTRRAAEHAIFAEALDVRGAALAAMENEERAGGRS